MLARFSLEGGNPKATDRSLRGFSFRPRPRVILVEELGRHRHMADLETLPVTAILIDNGYDLMGFLGHNLYFRDRS